MNAVTNGLHWVSFTHKPYGSLDRTRSYPCDKCSCWNNNHKLKRSVKQFWMIIQKLWSYWKFWFALCLINSKGDNLKTIQLQKAAIWEHGPILKQTKRILNADTSETHLRNKLVYSDKKDYSYNIFHCFSINWDYSFSEIWTPETFCVFVGDVRYIFWYK